MMRSTDHNLNNPMSVDPIQLEPQYDALEMLQVCHMPKHLYDQLAIKDPYTLYIVTDLQTGAVSQYYGENLIPHTKQTPQYLMALNEQGEYVIYQNERDERYPFKDCLIDICRHDNPQDAINVLRMFNKVGSHHLANISIYRLLVSYIKKDISINDFIIGVLGVYGYRDHPKLQQVIQTTYSYGVMEGQIDPQDKDRGYGKYQMDIPVLLRNEIGELARAYPESLYPYYSAIYDVIIKYDFFRHPDYQSDPDNANLSEAVTELFHIYWK